MVSGYLNREMRWYFDRGIKKRAIILDESNFSRETFQIFSVISKRLREILRRKDVELGYSCPGGTNEVRNWIADYESQIEETEVNPKNVVVNSGGCTGTINHLFRVIFEEEARLTEKKVIIPTPVYPGILTSARYNHLEPILIDTMFERGFRPTAEEISVSMDNGVAAIFITTPGNPSCTYTEESELKKIIELAREFNCYIIIDAIFEETNLTNRRQKSFAFGKDYGKLVKIKGPSKDRPQLNDLRMGWSISNNEDLAERLITAAEVSSSSNSTLMEKLVIEDIKYRDAMYYLSRGLDRDALEIARKEDILAYERELKDFRERISTGMEGAIDALKDSSSIDRIISPHAGNVIFARVKKNEGVEDSHMLFEYVLNRANIMISPGHLFMMPPNELWFRITMSKNPAFFIKKVEGLIQTLEYLFR